MDVTALWCIAIAVLILVGFTALLWPRRLIDLNQVVSNTVDTNKIVNVNQEHYLERKIYRSHKLIGSLILMVSCVTLYIVLFVIGDRSVIKPSAEALIVAQNGLAEFFLIVSLLAGILGIGFGFVMLLRPSLLKPLEHWGNRWYSLPEQLLDKPVSWQLDAWVAKHTRLFGITVLLSAGLIGFLVFG